MKHIFRISDTQYLPHRNGEEHMGNEIYRLQPKAKAWEKMKITMKEPRNFHSVVMVEPKTINCSSGFHVHFMNFTYI